MYDYFRGRFLVLGTHRKHRDARALPAFLARGALPVGWVASAAKLAPWVGLPHSLTGTPTRQLPPPTCTEMQKP